MSVLAEVSFRCVGPSPPATLKVDIRPHLDERVAQWIDAVHPRNRIEDDLPTLQRQLVVLLVLGEQMGPPTFWLSVRLIATPASYRQRPAPKRATPGKVEGLAEG